MHECEEYISTLKIEIFIHELYKNYHYSFVRQKKKVVKEQKISKEWIKERITCTEDSAREAEEEGAIHS